MAIVEYVSEEERRKITEKMTDALCRGASDEELNAIGGRVPVLPCLAKTLKENIGLKALLESDLNLYDAVQEYGQDFLTAE